MINHSAEEIEAEVLRAVKELGCGTFFSDDMQQRLSVWHDGDRYMVTYNYSYLTYKYIFSLDQVEGILA